MSIMGKISGNFSKQFRQINFISGNINLQLFEIENFHALVCLDFWYDPYPSYHKNQTVYYAECSND